MIKSTVSHNPLRLQEAQTQLLAFEEKYTIRLPESYRTYYLNNVNRNIIGLPYPLYQLDKVRGWLFYEDDETRKMYLHTPCQIYPEIGETIWQEWNEYGFDEDNQIDDETRQQHDLRVYGGMLPIGTEGCTIEIALILNGQYRGQVVFFDCVYPQYYPVFMGDFADWYESQFDMFKAVK